MRITFIYLIVWTMVIGTLRAQEITPEMVTDRPDQTESAAIVPAKSLQIETGFEFEKTNRKQYTIKNTTFHSTLLRYGLSKRFELRLENSYVSSSFSRKNELELIAVDKGLGPLSPGFKLLLSKPGADSPAIALLASATLPGIGHMAFRPSKVAPAFRFNISMPFGEALSLATNVGAEWDGLINTPTYIYTFAVGYSATPKLGLFAESYGFIHDLFPADHRLDGGVTFSVKPNVQLDAMAGVGLSAHSPTWLVGTGISVRIPQ